MKKKLLLFFLMITMLFVTGCEIGSKDSDDEKEEKTKEVEKGIKVGKYYLIETIDENGKHYAASKSQADPSINWIDVTSEKRAVMCFDGDKNDVKYDDKYFINIEDEDDYLEYKIVDGEIEVYIGEKTLVYSLGAKPDNNSSKKDDDDDDDDDKYSNMVGKYVLIGGSVDGVSLTSEQIEELYSKYSVNFKSSNNIETVFNGSSFNMKCDDKYFINKEDSTDKIAYSYSSGTLTLTVDGDSYVIVKFYKQQ